MGDAASRIGWGVVLAGDADDLEDWHGALKHPFDPWVMKVEIGLILRSSRLDGEATAIAVYERAKALMEVNGALRASHRTGIVRLEAMAEVFSDGACRRHLFAQLRVTEARDRASMVVVVGGPEKPAPPPEPSEPQRWLSIAAEDDLLADALTYFARCDDWFDVYKALECLEMRFGGERKGQAERFRRLGWADADKFDLLRWTANSGRHARKKFDPPPQPMERTEAHDLLAKLMACAFREAANMPKPPL
jgi:hypothetical protein